MSRRSLAHFSWLNHAVIEDVRYRPYQSACAALLKACFDGMSSELIAKYADAVRATAAAKCSPAIRYSLLCGEFQ